MTLCELQRPLRSYYVQRKICILIMLALECDFVAIVNNQKSRLILGNMEVLHRRPFCPIDRLVKLHAQLYDNVKAHYQLTRNLTTATHYYIALA